MPRRRIAVAAAVAVALSAAGLVAGVTLAFDGGGVAIRAESVAVVDAKSGKVIADVPPMPLGAHPQALAFGFHSVWVANTNDGTVSRLDARTRKVTGVIGVGAGVRDIATGFGSVWVANGTEGTVTRIDPALNAPVETLRLSGENAAAAPVNFIATGSRAVWVTRGSELLRIEPATGSVTRLATPPPVGLTVRGETAWVVTLEQRLLVIGADPAGRLSSRAEALPLTAPAAAPTPGGSAIWLIVYRGTGQLWKVGSRGSEAKVRMPYFPLALASSAGKLWAVDVRGRLLRVDARRGRIEWTTALRPTLRSAVAVGDGKVWVAVEAAS